MTIEIISTRVLRFPDRKIEKTAHDSAVKTTECLTDSEAGELSEDEKDVLETYRQATPEVRALMQRLALRLLQRRSKT
jgi:hypothetical protein